MSSCLFKLLVDFFLFCCSGWCGHEAYIRFQGALSTKQQHRHPRLGKQVPSRPRTNPKVMYSLQCVFVFSSTEVSKASKHASHTTTRRCIKASANYIKNRKLETQSPNGVSPVPSQSDVNAALRTTLWNASLAARTNNATLTIRRGTGCGDVTRTQTIEATEESLCSVWTLLF